MSHMYSPGTLNTKRRETAPRRATITMSNTRSTTREEIPCEMVDPNSCLRMNTRTRSPSLAGTIRFAVCEMKIQPVEKRMLHRIPMPERIILYRTPRRSHAREQTATARAQ